VLLPGGGTLRSDCYLEFEVGGGELSARGVECADGDPSCDLDGACNGRCRFAVSICVNQVDPALPSCTPPAGLLRASERGAHQVGLRFPALASSACGAFVGVDAPIRRHGRRPGRRIRTTAISPGRPRRDTDVILLFCRPPVGPCPTTTSTSSTTTSSITTTTEPPPPTPNADTGITSGDPDANLGGFPQIFIGNDTHEAKRALLRFDLTAVPPGSTITSCTLVVDVVTHNNPGSGKIHRLKQTAWVESAATWNRYDGATGWTTPGAFNPSEAQSDVVVTPGPDGPIAYTAPTKTGAFTFPDLTTLCQDAVTNRGSSLDILVKQDDDTPGTTAEFSISRRTDSVEAQRPMLMVAFVPGG
jgi:hypothetical protein